MKTDKQSAEQLKPYQFRPGESGNPAGRPKGKTIKERVQEWLDTHPEDMESFVKHFVKENRDLAWQMMEGRPSQSTDITSDGEKIEFNVTLTDDNTNTKTVSSNEGHPQV